MSQDEIPFEVRYLVEELAGGNRVVSTETGQALAKMLLNIDERLTAIEKAAEYAEEDAYRRREMEGY